MLRNKSWFKTVLAMLAGAILTLAAQGLSERWSRHAQAATLDEFARSTMANLVSSLPWTGKGKIKGIAGLGDGRTFIVYTDDNIQFYQFNFGPTSSTPSR